MTRTDTGRQRPLTLWTVTATLALLLGAPASAQLPYAGLVVFGTSLSDPGNAFALRGGNNTPPDYILDALLIPGAAYPRGGHTATNGAPWIVQLGRSLGLPRGVQAAYRSESPEATNYAVIGARGYDDGSSVSFADQVAQFLSEHGGRAPADRLYVVEFGSNDLRDAIATYLAGGDGNAIVQAALTAIGAQLGVLYGAGARDFLIANAPDIGLTPAVRILDAQLSGAGIPALATLLTVTFNAGLDAAVAQLPPDANVVELDIFTTLYAIVANPGAFGLTNVTEACVTPGIPPFTCRDPDEYLFWDGAHPTRTVHGLFANEAAAALAGSP